ncbi:unnamed protein product [Echinostoma caproni]|uniref:diphosphoinositol-pentakisphosphate 1-kinase n=1 Tax=Echinostoma caproni TaxID=27848 RepID=A0A183AH50_9TREM|nr:unnamed protein product [Echinostoma caproni]
MSSFILHGLLLPLPVVPPALHCPSSHPSLACCSLDLEGVASPERFVRTRLYFTSESHLHSLLTCLRYGELADVTTDEQWRRAMDYVSSISEINYLAQIVIMIYEDPTEEPKTEKRFHVELHFSPGAFALCHDLPEGIGFRPGKLELCLSMSFHLPIPHCNLSLIASRVLFFTHHHHDHRS